MKKLALLTISSLCLTAQPMVDYVDENENRVYKNPQALPVEAKGLSVDLGYTNYQIDVVSTEFDRAIDYDVLELSIGGSTSYGRWLYGVNFKSLIKEIESNVNISEVGNLLNDEASIDRMELSLYATYHLSNIIDFNMVFRHSKLNASDSYVSFVDYNTDFEYQTDGLALALTFNKIFAKKHQIWLSSGLAYSHAFVKISESVNSKLDDTYIDDSSTALGFKLGTGYNYQYNKNLIFKISGDFYQFDFGNIEVRSKSQNSVLENATLNEKTLSVRAGFAYRF